MAASISLRAVVDRQDLGAGRQASGDLGELRLDPLDDAQGVRAEALQDDAAGDLAVTVHLCEAAPLVRPQFDAGDIPDPQGGATGGLQHDVLDVGDASEVAPPPHHELELGEFDGAAADIGVARADRVPQLVERDALSPQAVRFDHHVVLLHEAANAGDLSHALGPRGTEADHPILDRAQLGERPFPGHDDVLVDPADTGGIGAERRCHPGRQATRRRVEIFEHPRPAPIRIGAVFEDHIDERDTEEREAADHLGLRHREHGGGEGIGDLVLDDLGACPGYSV